jgi:hypothetical protein
VTDVWSGGIGGRVVRGSESVNLVGSNFFTMNSRLINSPVVSAYSDGTKLVRRIKEKRQQKKIALAAQSTEDLENSLSLGPVIVQGQYEYDFRRFGDVR